MKKRALAIIMAFSLCICLLSGISLAADEETETDAAPVEDAEQLIVPAPEEEEDLLIETEEEDVSVFVTVAVAGTIEVGHTMIDVSDVDEDGAYTVYDALVCVHEYYYEGEDEAEGFAVSDGMITKLWGIENGGAYGYYLNNTMCMGLLDPIAEYDHLVAFVYQDTETWTDMYTYFEEVDVKACFGQEITLKLMGVAFDENWNTVTVPVAGAKILIDGEETEYVTDEEGKVTLTFDEDSDFYYLISAVSDDAILVPPVCDLWLDVAILFEDISGHWAEEYIVDMVQRGLLKGISATEFAPNLNVTRAMIVTVLYRIQGEPEVTGKNVFGDVEEDTWYTDAVIWASENKIVLGSDGMYRPDDALTRSEAVVILYRWAQYYFGQFIDLMAQIDMWNLLADILDEEMSDEFDLDAYLDENSEAAEEYAKLIEEAAAEVAKFFTDFDEAVLEGYTDAGQIEDWAMDAWKWASSAEIISGTTGTTLSPQLTLDRAQLAAILARAL